MSSDVDDSLLLYQRVEGLSSSCRNTSCEPCMERRRHIENASAAVDWGEDLVARAELAAAESVDGKCICESAPRGNHTSGVTGRVDGFLTGGRLLAATDASWREAHGRNGVGRGCGGFGYVLSDGRWGLRSWQSPRFSRHHLNDPSGPSIVAVLELRAIGLLLDAGVSDTSVLIDSAPALHLIGRWRAGDTAAMPHGYSLRPRTRRGGTPTLVRLAQTIAARPDVTFEKVSGHSGHPLNEAADSLAKVACQRATGEKLDIHDRASTIVKGHLTDFRRQ